MSGERMTAEREDELRSLAGAKGIRSVVRSIIRDLLRELDATRKECDNLDAELRYAKATIDTVCQQRDEARTVTDAMVERAMAAALTAALSEAP